jgi:D-serine deaminase-like pyridoxal phosphate-dependent protein
MSEWQRFRRVLDGRRLPAAVVDVDAFDRNVDRLVAPLRAAGKRLRIATKSLRCPALVARVAARAGDLACGLMTYTAAESAWWAANGSSLGHVAHDQILAYPIAREVDLDDVVDANRTASCALVVDSREHVAAAAAAARAAGVSIPVVVELDVSWRPLAGALHVGAMRSPLRAPDAVAALARTIAATDGVRFAGVMAYEAQIAGVTDTGPFQRWEHGVRRAIKRISRDAVARLRAETTSALVAAGLAPAIFNGGGTGSVAWTVTDPEVTEVTIGSGFVGARLFDDYRDLALEPAACFALQVVRRPSREIATCHGGGYVASGDGGRDRLPTPWLPPGCRLLAREGAGEVQTPVVLPPGVEVALGDPIVFRHAKAGELAEHFDRYLLVSGDRVIDEVPTWRGLGCCFLG